MPGAFLLRHRLARSLCTPGGGAAPEFRRTTLVGSESLLARPSLLVHGLASRAILPLESGRQATRDAVTRRLGTGSTRPRHSEGPHRACGGAATCLASGVTVSASGVVWRAAHPQMTASGKQRDSTHCHTLTVTLPGGLMRETVGTRGGTSGRSGGEASRLTSRCAARRLQEHTASLFFPRVLLLLCALRIL